MDAGMSVPSSLRVKQGPKIPRAHLGLKAVTYMDKSERESQKKMNSPHLSGAGNLPMDGKNIWCHSIQDTLHPQTQLLGCGFISLPFFQTFPLVAIHICFPCARLPVSPTCWTQGVGPKPKMRIYEATSALSETNARVGQDCVVLVACGRDPAPRRGGGGTNTERKDICSLSYNGAVRGSSFFAQRLVYLCWKEAQKHISSSSGDDKHPSMWLPILRNSRRRGRKICFCVAVPCERCATWAICHHKEEVLLKTSLFGTLSL